MWKDVILCCGPRSDWGCVFVFPVRRQRGAASDPGSRCGHPSLREKWESSSGATEERARAPGTAGAMRQLKGKPKKETSKDKKERKQAMQEARQQIATVVLPTLAVVVLLIVVFVYVATRPGAIE
ncbi:hypothetical protein SKAU_G00079820 [Synaphobranchus kaupii]|uniref:Single-pass membrane and coiled-coil domain-containing protein 4 n=1 Tax=Synaphobranchus kaupii TaxID=118154 RepID=A0A9Q1J532_SYNKA|nr:hypothetical protein SKAU_G00079820 [Synaphobranchus kaupii]